MRGFISRISGQGKIHSVPKYVSSFYVPFKGCYDNFTRRFSFPNAEKYKHITLLNYKLKMIRQYKISEFNFSNLHSRDAPAKMVYLENNTMIKGKYYINGELDRSKPIYTGNIDCCYSDHEGSIKMFQKPFIPYDFLNPKFNIDDDDIRVICKYKHEYTVLYKLMDNLKLHSCSGQIRRSLCPNIPILRHYLYISSPKNKILPALMEYKNGILQRAVYYNKGVKIDAGDKGIPLAFLQRFSGLYGTQIVFLNAYQNSIIFSYASDSYSYEFIWHLCMCIDKITQTIITIITYIVIVIVCIVMNLCGIYLYLLIK